MFEGRLDSLGHKKVILIAFIVGFVIRLIPEILSFPNPIGWDTIYYASRINDGFVWNNWTDIFSTWLIYAILVGLRNLTVLDAIMLLKIVAPLLFGGTTAAIYFVAWKKLNWSVSKSLFTSFIFSIQLATLTISWHFYRNIFGMMALLFTLPFLKNNLNWKETTLLSIFSIIVVLGHEFAAVSLFAIVLALVVFSLYKKERIPYQAMFAIIPAGMFFILSMIKGLVFSLPTTDINPTILSAGDSFAANPGGLFFLTNYLNVVLPNQNFVNYFDLFFTVISLFVLLYALIVPLVLVGYFKDRILSSWLTILFVGAFGCILFPFSALFLWHRWMLMLIFPLVFFAANGLWRLLSLEKGNFVTLFRNKLRFNKKFAVFLSFFMILTGSIFMVFPLIDGKYGAIGFGSTFKYVPSTMQSNSLPVQDTQDALVAFDWLNSNMENNSSLLSHEAFEFWTLFCLEDSHAAIIFDFDLDQALKVSSDHDFDFSYFLWWNEPICWYQSFDLSQFDEIQDFGRLSVYKFSEI